MVREGLVAVLDADPRLHVIGSASTLAEFLIVYRQWDAEVVVTDDDLGDGSGIEVARHVLGTDHPPAVVLISGHDDQRQLDEAIDAGCSGFVFKGLPSSQLADTIDTVARGATVFTPAASSPPRLPDARSRLELTQREMETLELLAQAKPVAEIAAAMFVSVHTVRNHIRSVLTKLDARSQLDAVVIAVREGLVRID